MNRLKHLAENSVIYMMSEFNVAGEGFRSSQVAAFLHCSKPTAMKKLEDLKAQGLVDYYVTQHRPNAFAKNWYVVMDKVPSDLLVKSKMYYYMLFEELTRKYEDE